MLHYGKVFSTFEFLDLTFQIDIGFVLLALLLPLYLCVDFVTGLVSSVYFICQLVLSTYLYQNYA